MYVKRSLPKFFLFIFVGRFGVGFFPHSPRISVSHIYLTPILYYKNNKNKPISLFDNLDLENVKYYKIKWMYSYKIGVHPFFLLLSCKKCKYNLVTFTIIFFLAFVYQNNKCVRITITGRVMRVLSMKRINISLRSTGIVDPSITAPVSDI